MSLLKKLAGQTALYGLSSILGRAINFLLVPFYTAVLVPVQFGTITELYAYVAFFNILYLYGMETAYFRFATKDNLTEESVFNQSETTLIFSSLLMSGAVLLLSPLIADGLDYHGHSSYFILLGTILAIDSMLAIPFARLRLQNKAGVFATAKLFNILVNVGFNIFFLVFCKKIAAGEQLPSLKPLIQSFYSEEHVVEYILLANLIASFLTIFFLLKTFKGFKIDFNWERLKPMLVYSIPMLFIGLAGMVDEMLSRIILKYVLPDGFYPNRTNLEALGIFGACYRLSMFMTLAVQSFRYASDPFFFSQAKDKNAPELFATVMKWFVIACAFLYVVVSCNLSLFEKILRGEIFREGILVVPVLLMANLFLGIYYNLSIWYKLTDKTQLGTLISIFGAAITITANFILIPFFGYMGSAVTTLICYFLMSTISYLWGKKYFPVPYKLGSALFYLTFAVILSILALSYPFGKGSIMSYGFQVILLGTYLFVVFLIERKQMNFKAS